MIWWTWFGRGVRSRVIRSRRRGVKPVVDRLAAVALPMLLAVAACGDSDDGGDATPVIDPGDDGV